MNMPKISRAKLELLLLVGIAVILFYYASKAPLTAEDEAVYIDLARKIQQNHGLYPTWDYSSMNSKTGELGAPKRTLPLLSYVLSPFSTLPMWKMVMAMFGILTMVMIYFFAEKYVKKGTGIIASMTLFSVPLFVAYSLIAYTDIPIAFFSIASLYFFLGDGKKNSIISGVFLGLGMLTKFSILILPVALFFYAIHKGRFKSWAIMFLISMVLLMPWVARNYYFFGFGFYPVFDDIQLFLFGNPYPPQFGQELAGAQQSISFLTLISYLGTSIIFLSILGSLYSYFEKKDIGFLSILIIMIFLITLYSGIAGFMDVRYFVVILPELAILTVIGWNSLFENHKRLIAISIIGIILSSLIMGVTQAMGSSMLTRYTEEYVDALGWVKQNTNKTDFLMTTFCGGAIFYSERDCVWPVKYMREVMTTQSDEEILDILQKYNVKYILVDGDYVSQSYVVQGSNIAGVYTFNFLNIIGNSTKFKLVYRSTQQTMYQNGKILPFMSIYEVL